MARLRILAAAALVGLAAAGGLHAAGALDGAETASLDARFAVRDARPAPELVVVAVDERTFGEKGWQWPFSRRVYADLTDVLRRADPRLLVYDIQFTEKSDPEADYAFYDALERAGGAVLATGETDGRGGHAVFGGEQNLRPIGATAAASNFPDDFGGTVRELERSSGGLATIAVKVAERLGRPVAPGAFRDGRAWIDFRGPPGTIRTVSFADVLDGNVPPAVFRDRIVVVGASAPTLQDLHPTPTSRRGLMPGPEIQANAIWTALNGMPLRSAPGWTAAVATVALALLVPLLLLVLGPVASASLGVVAAFAYLAGAHLAFEQGLVLAVVVPLVALAASTIAAIVGAVVLERRERRAVDAYAHRLEEAVRERTADLDALQVEIIERLGRAVDWRDEETGEHIQRIGTLARDLALAAGLDRDHAEMVRRASAMHDVGKVAIADGVLQKPGPLTPEERRDMEQHTLIGARILAGSRSPLVRMAERIALTHHERWDGTGYPHGLAGEDIPIEGRIVAVCDVYDALVSRRPYKAPWPHADALEEIARGAGSHFDPRLARLFVTVLRDRPPGSAGPAPDPGPGLDPALEQGRVEAVV